MICINTVQAKQDAAEVARKAAVSREQAIIPAKVIPHGNEPLRLQDMALKLHNAEAARDKASNQLTEVCRTTLGISLGNRTISQTLIELARAQERVMLLPQTLTELAGAQERVMVQAKAQVQAESLSKKQELDTYLRCFKLFCPDSGGCIQARAVGEALLGLGSPYSDDVELEQGSWQAELDFDVPHCCSQRHILKTLLCRCLQRCM